MNSSFEIKLQATHVTCQVPQPLAGGATSTTRAPLLPHKPPRSESSKELKTIFSELSLNLYAGDLVDLVGPSGVGKSTLLTSLAQLNPDAKAQMQLEGKPSTSMTPEAWRRSVAYVPQRPTLTGQTVREAILMPYTLRIHQRSEDGTALNESKPSEETLRRTLNEVGCSDIELDRPPQDLSVGQQARVCLLRTLLTYPKVLLADEVDAGLDDENAEKVGSMLAYAARQGMAIIRVRHRNADGRATRTLRLQGNALHETQQHHEPADAAGADSGSQLPANTPSPALESEATR